jgi:hypothetical protein
MSTSERSNDAASQMFGQAAKMFQTAMEAGAKMQEDSAKSLNEMISGLGAPQEWQKHAQDAMEKAIAMMQQNMDEALNVVNENTKTSLELLEKAFSARQTDAPADVQARAKEMWETALGSLRRNTEVIVQANSRLVQSWQEMAQILGDKQSDGKPDAKAEAKSE